MRIFIKSKWASGFLDQALLDYSIRIIVKEWYNLKPITDIYTIPKKSWQTIYNYLFEIGLVNVIRKVRSRFAEEGRNEKFVNVGRGTVIESRVEEFKMHQSVLFLAPCHSPCMERVVLRKELVILDEDDVALQNKEFIQYEDLTQFFSSPELLQSLVGWSEFSGKGLPSHLPKIIREVFKIIISRPIRNYKNLVVSYPSKISERISCYRSKKLAKPTGVIFGYGQYAKTCILPNVKKYINTTCIHEIDPTQIGNVQKKFIFDTSPEFRDFEKYDLCFLAGYHHTHAPLATYALARGMSVIVEKPLVTTWDDFSQLLNTLEKTTGFFYSGFQKRYTIFNNYIYQDLGVVLGDPISYSCIVFEIPLGDLHWYKWPNSKSRVLSNGCHWIDHFLFLNNYCEVYKQSLYVAKNGGINIVIELTNGAIFTMLLTDIGSNRIGLQEYVELRARSSTVKMTNSSCYIAEDSQKILRKLKVNKLSSYHRMYQSIAKNFSTIRQGDSLESIKLSSSVILSLEDELQAQ